MSSRGILLAAAWLFATAFVALFAFALHTGLGRSLDAHAYSHVSGGTFIRTHAAAARALRTIDASSLALGAMLVVLAAAVRGRLTRAAGALAVIPLTVGSAELLKHGLGHVVGAVPAGRAASFPSGHTSIAVSLAAALVVAVPSTVRPVAALAGAAYAAGIGLSVIVVGAHYPSDAAASFFLGGFWTSLVALATRARPRVRTPSGTGAAVSVVGMALCLFVAAAVAGRHPAAVESLRDRRTLVAVAGTLALLSLATFGTLTVLVAEGDP